jgi:cytochrome P450
MATTRHAGFQANVFPMSIASSAYPQPPGPDAPLDLEKQPDKLGTLADLLRRYGDCYRVTAVSRDAETWVVNDPEMVRRILVANHRNYTKGIGIERIRVLLGNGLMTSEGDTWRRQRRQMQSGFHRTGVEARLPLFLDVARQQANSWQQAAHSGKAVNVTEAVSEAALQVILRALFSVDLVDLPSQSFDLISSHSNRDLQFAVKFRALGKQIQGFVDRRRKNNDYPPDLLSHTMLAVDRSSGAGMSDRQIIDEILTLIVAGHETTAASLNWVWYLLAVHPRSMQRVVDEARQLNFDSLDSSALESLAYTRAVLCEALRLYPPGWLYTRRALDDDQLGPYTLPAGSDVFICSYLLHRHPGYWEQPDLFSPDRFMGDANWKRYAYLPYSAGPRHCIGEAFANMEMLVHLAVIASQVSPEAPGQTGVDLDADVNLRPRKPLWLKFRLNTHG